MYRKRRRLLLRDEEDETESLDIRQDVGQGHFETEQESIEPVDKISELASEDLSLRQ